MNGWTPAVTNKFGTLYVKEGSFINQFTFKGDKVNFVRMIRKDLTDPNPRLREMAREVLAIMAPSRAN